MSLFAIGDTHLSFGSDKPMNVFDGWDRYTEKLEANWRSRVGEKDTVVLMGDISWAMTLNEARADFAFLDALPGKKILMKGNHDFWWNTRKKLNEFFEANSFGSFSILHNSACRVGDICVCGTRGWFFDAETGADKKIVRREAQRLKASIEAGRALGGELVVFLHYPPLTKAQRCEEIYAVLQAENVSRCYYAHLHGAAARLSFNGMRDGIKFELLSGDHLGFCPKAIEKIK